MTHKSVSLSLCIIVYLAHIDSSGLRRTLARYPLGLPDHIFTSPSAFYNNTMLVYQLCTCECVNVYVCTCSVDVWLEQLEYSLINSSLSTAADGSFSNNMEYIVVALPNL